MTTKTVARMEVRVAEETAGLMGVDGAANTSATQAGQGAERRNIGRPLPYPSHPNSPQPFTAMYALLVQVNRAAPGFLG